jgi:hypothetical protein
MPVTIKRKVPGGKERVFVWSMRASGFGKIELQLVTSQPSLVTRVQTPEISFA